MVKHTETIRQQFAEELFWVFGHFVGLALNPLSVSVPSYRNQSVDLLCKSIDWFLYDGNTGT